MIESKEHIISNIVKAYFDEPDKTLKEVFGEYAEELNESEREQFFKTLREIIY
ncbi:MarR family transcriptional regulator [Clostridium butyricum]|uniref:MarR family transcriptional regulator n=1 Tax=Clostridium butyricum TaxID=1492 RepID=UPI003467CD76